MIDQQTILKEMESLERQRAEKVADVHRIDGAMEMCRHLLAKGQQAQARTGDGPNGGMSFSVGDGEEENGKG